MTTLVVDCCIREDLSRTRKFYNVYLNSLDTKDDIDYLYLTKQNIRPQDKEYLVYRNKCLASKDYNNKIFDFANQFKDADEIIIAAPYWDLMFPALLKVYLEYVSVAGITFCYGKDGLVGLCKAKSVKYFTTAGGEVGENNLGFLYIKKFADMVGIKNCRLFQVDKLDIYPSKAEEMLLEEINKNIACDK